MYWIARFLLCAYLLTRACASLADAPLVSALLELKVTSCERHVFRAPEGQTDAYISGDTYATTLIAGTIVSAALSSYNKNDKYSRAFAESVKAGLPKQGETTRAVLPAWDINVCEAILHKQKWFAYDYRCDTFPRSGPCLPEFPLMQLLN